MNKHQKLHYDRLKTALAEFSQSTRMPVTLTLECVGAKTAGKVHAFLTDEEVHDLMEIRRSGVSLKKRAQLANQRADAAEWKFKSLERALGMKDAKDLPAWLETEFLSLADTDGNCDVKAIMPAIKMALQVARDEGARAGQIKALRMSQKSVFAVEINPSSPRALLDAIERISKNSTYGKLRSVTDEIRLPTSSVLPNWIFSLSMQQQSVLMLALRGPDNIRKHHPMKDIQRHYRASVLKAAYFGRNLHNGEAADDFMSMAFIRNDKAWADMQKVYFQHIDELPHHFHMHLMHGAEILGYKHPDLSIRRRWNDFYLACCDDAHVPHETEETMDRRLGDWKREHWGK